MTTETKSLVERAKVNVKEILGGGYDPLCCLPNGTEIAEAQLAKALRVVVEVGREMYEVGHLATEFTPHFLDWLDGQLKALDMERPSADG